MHYYPDADLNGDIFSTKSTSGYWIELQGPGGRGIALDWGAKKQDFTASHTQESETVSLSTHLRNQAIPIAEFMSQLLGRPVDLICHEDNSSCIAAVKHGYSPSLRHLPRTHRVSLGMLHDTFHELEPKPGEAAIALIKEETKNQKGDLLTKAKDYPAFSRSMKLLRMVQDPRSKT